MSVANYIQLFKIVLQSTQGGYGQPKPKKNYILNTALIETIHNPLFSTPTKHTISTSSDHLKCMQHPITVQLLNNFCPYLSTQVLHTFIQACIDIN